MQDHTKIFFTFLLDLFLLILGISLVELHLFLSCISIFIVTFISIFKFIFWFKKNNNNDENNEKTINRPL